MITKLNETFNCFNILFTGLTYSTVSLLSTVVILIFATHWNGWKLDKKFGAVLMIGYFVFITFASLYELNVFGNMNPPVCKSEYQNTHHVQGNLHLRILLICVHLEHDISKWPKSIINENELVRVFIEKQYKINHQNCDSHKLQQATEEKYSHHSSF